MTASAIVDDRLDTLVLARLETSARPPKPRELAQTLRRFAPREVADAQWREQIGGVLEGLRARELVTPEGRPRSGEVARRLGGPVPKRWQALTDRVLPAVALGIAPSDTKAHGRLKGRDAWGAAIVARGLDLWRTGPPPSLGDLCDALVWRTVGVAGTPQRCPPELRAHFLRPHVEGAAGPADRLVRVLAAKLVGAPRAELRALLDGLVRLWLEAREFGTKAAEAQPAETQLAEVHLAAAHPVNARAVDEPPAGARLTDVPGNPRSMDPRSTDAHLTDARSVDAPPVDAPPADPRLTDAPPADPRLTDAPPTDPRLTDAPPTEVRSLIADVRAAVAAERVGVFGERKVFVSAIWEALRKQPAWATLELDDLKAQLMAAHRARELLLARADLVAAMPYALVEASEIQTDGATFHFVVREPKP